jgi:hypothetical protein
VKTNSRTIAFCDTAEDIQAISLMDDEVRPDTIIAVKPEAAWWCQKINIAYNKPEDYFDKDELFDMGFEITKRNLTWIDWVDQFLRQIIPEFKLHSFSPARIYTLPLHLFLSEIACDAYILNKIFDAVNPSLVMLGKENFLPPGTWSRIVPRSFSMTSLVEVVARRNGIKAENIFTRSSFSQDYINSCILDLRRTNRLEFWLNLNNRLKINLPLSLKVHIKRIIQFGIVAYMLTWLSKVSVRNKGNVICLGYGYDLDYICLSLQRKGVRVKQLYDPASFFKVSKKDLEIFQSRIDKCWGQIIQKDEFWLPIISCGIEPNKSIEWVFHRWWFGIIPQLWFYFINSKFLFKEKKYNGVLTWAIGEGLNGTIFSAAKACDIPTFVYMHGGVSRCNWDNLVISEMFLTDNYLVQGDGIKRILRKRAESLTSYKVSARVTSVGSPLLDFYRSKRWIRTSRQIRKTILKTKYRALILYIPTFYGNEGFRLFDTWLVDSDYFHFQEKLLSVFSHFREFLFIYKEFPGSLALVTHNINPLINFINERRIDNVVVIKDILLAKLIFAVDTIILDHNQTALCEALLTSKPILVFEQGSMSQRVTEPIALDLLKKRALVARTQEDFLKLVENFLRAGDFSEIQNPNDEFLRAYGTHLNDGLSAERASEYILEIVNEREQK